ncbi:MAG: hypothetical protein ACLQME_20335 [Alphaproteobacteria bacterium]
MKRRAVQYLIASVAVLALVAYALDHGIFIGSTEQNVNQPPAYLVYKTCRYLFITGIADKPALGGDGAGYVWRGHEAELYCRVLAE